MSSKRTQRLINLVIALLTSRTPLTKHQLRHLYGMSAWERTFERDKDDLRALGVQIETIPMDSFSSKDEGYRIRRDEFELPEIEFTSAEAQALGVAARAWGEASAASYTDAALLKLRAAGVEIDHDRLLALWPAMGGTDPAFEPVREALINQSTIMFRYRGGDVRRVDPWSLKQRGGAWYVVGYDHDRDAPRRFKLARMTSVPTIVGYAVVPRPSDEELRELESSLEPKVSSEHAVVFIRPGKALTLRRGALSSDIAAPDGYDAVTIPLPDDVGELVQFGEDVLVAEPRWLREQAVARLTAMAGGDGHG